MASPLVSFSTFAAFKIRTDRCAGLSGAKTRNPKSCELKPKCLIHVEPFLVDIANNAFTDETFNSLATYAFCHYHVKYASKAAKHWHDEWKSSNNGSLQMKESASKSPFQEIQEHAASHETESEYTSAPSSPYESDIDDDKTLVGTPPPKPLKFRILKPDASDHDVAKKLSNILEQKPTVHAKALGTIYAIAVLHEPGLYKVGVTTKDVEIRKQKHTKCYGEIEMSNTSLVAWAPRIESLVHAELGKFHYHQSNKCIKCNTFHRELFRVNIKDIRDAIEKWTRFFIENPDPYKSDGRLKDDVKLPPPAFRRGSPNSTPSKKGTGKARTPTTRSLPSCEDSPAGKASQTSTKSKSSRRPSGNIFINNNITIINDGIQGIHLESPGHSDRSRLPE